jgi:hypothetical protein
LSKSVQRTTFSPWSESPNLPFVRFIVKPKITISRRFWVPKRANLQMTAMSPRWHLISGDSYCPGVAGGSFELSKSAEGDWVIARDRKGKSSLRKRGDAEHSRGRE